MKIKLSFLLGSYKEYWCLWQLLNRKLHPNNTVKLSELLLFHTYGGSFIVIDLIELSIVCL